MCTHSDTALFKVKKRGIYILLTDFDSICAVEVRMTSVSDTNFTMNTREFTAKDSVGFTGGRTEESL